MKNARRDNLALEYKFTFFSQGKGRVNLALSTQV